VINFTKISRANSIKIFCLLPLRLLTDRASPLNIKYGHPIIHQCRVKSSAGKALDDHIQDLTEDYFSLTNGSNSNGQIGLSNLFEGLKNNKFKLSYSIDNIYLKKIITISDDITKKRLFTNLSSSYNLAQPPIYAVGKLPLNLRLNRYQLMLNTGDGPNIIDEEYYHDRSLNGFTLPDNAYSCKGTPTLSAIFGVGIIKL